ncbi:Adaptive-response sensory-kinase SasA [subsurface metagenome]
MFEYGAGFLAAAGVAIFNYFYTTSVRTRQQMKIVLIGCLAALVPLLVLNLLPEAIWRQPIIPSGYSILLIVFIPLSMGYAVVTQKLMDIDVVIRRSVIYGLISLVMAVILSAAIIPAVAYQESLGVPGGILIALALGGIANILFGPTKKGIETLVDRLFYKDRYDYRQIIQSLSTSLSSLKDFADISRLIVGTTVNTLNLAGGCLFVKAQSGSFEVSATQGTFANRGKQKKLLTLILQRSGRIEFPNSASTVDLDVAFLIPLVAVGKEVGILCLSQKIPRQDFSSDDLFLLQGIASVAAIALHSAMLIRDVSIRDNFVSIASHELRTPLTSIVGYTDLLLRRNPTDVTRKRWLKNIFDNSQRITAMVDDLLNVTRIQSGKVSLKVEGVKLYDTFREQLTMIRESTDKHEFVTDIEPDLPDALVDRDKFGQVLGNLLSNAVKYSPNGGRITISAHDEPQRHRIVVSVADEGIGIGPEDKGSLFTTFHRIQRPETQGIRGSGLGLYIAKEWTEAMGGEIWLESKLNKGSTFFVGIPTQNSDTTG